MSADAAEAKGRVLGELARLARDPAPAAQAVGGALLAAVVDALDDAERAWVADIATLRAEVVLATEEIDTALANARGVAKPMELGDVCQRRSKKEPWGIFLLTLARMVAPVRCIELGTCLGISASYLGAGMKLAGGGELTTLEGAPALAEQAAKHLARLGLDDVEVVSGLFASTLAGVLDGGRPVGLAFIDGHHQHEPTLAYFEQLASHLTEPAVVVFDDIRWSEGMELAWADLLRHPLVRVAVDLDSVGVCVVGPGTSDARIYRFPTVSIMRAAFAEEQAAGRPLEPISTEDMDVPRLNWGCGASGEPGWINADLNHHPSIQISGDIRDGLPLEDESMAYVVSVHGLPMISLSEMHGVLQELRRVLRPGGTLRLVLPDLDKGLAAYQAGETDYFQVPDHDAGTLSGKLITQLLWYGYSVTLFTAEFIEELLQNAGFSQVHHCAIGQTASDHPGITDLDNRERESLFVEAVK